jgi:hypothetical protein
MLARTMNPTLAAVRTCLLALLVGTAATAQNAARPFWTGPLPARDARMAQAEEWRKGFSALDQQIPTLSPSEAAWLRREYDDQIASNDGKFTPRALKAMDSNEFQSRRARQHLDLMIPVVSRLSARTYDSERQEITDWARLTSLLADGPFWSAVTNLVKRGVVKPEINGVSDFYHENHAMWSTVIIDRVVVPFLEQGK